MEDQIDYRYSHTFQRNRSIDYCYVCHEHWPNSDVVASKYYTCNVCDIDVHSGCRSMCKNCISCSMNEHMHKSKVDLNEYTYGSGYIAVKLMHVYDMVNISKGTSLYGTMTLDQLDRSDGNAIRSKVSICGDSECVWEKQNDSSLDSDTNALLSSRGRLLIKSSDVSSPLSLHLEIWRNHMFFDSIAAISTLSILPLLLYPRMICDRWFPLQDLEGGMPNGYALMRLMFIPDDMDLSLKAKKSIFSITADGINSFALNLTSDVVDDDKSNTTSDTLASDDSIVRSDSAAADIVETSAPVVDAVRYSVDDTDTRDASIVSTDLPTAAAASADDNALLNPLTSILSFTADSINRIALELANIDEVPVIAASQEEEVYEEAMDSFDLDEQNQQRYAVTVVNSATDSDIVTTPIKTRQPHVTISPSSIESSPSSVPVPLTSVKRPPPSPSSSGSNNSVALFPLEDLSVSHDDRADGASFTIGNQTAASVATAATASISSASNNIAKWAQDKIESVLHDVVGVGGAKAGNLTIGGNNYYNVDAYLKESQEPGTMLKSGIGRIYINLKSVTKSNVTDAADGDHYVLVTLSDTSQEERTQRIINSATPEFNRAWTFIVPHFRAVMRIYLVDAVTERKVGVATTSSYSIMQRDADLYKSNWKLADYEDIPLKDITEKEEIGHMTVKILFEEDVKSFFMSSNPRLIPNSPDESLSVERLSQHIERFKSAINLFNKCYYEYCFIMDWQNIPLSLTLFLTFLASVFLMNAEYALFCPLFIMVVLMTRTLQKRRSGIYRKCWIEKDIDSTNAMPRSVAILRVAVVDFKNIHSHANFSSSITSSSGSNSSSNNSLASTATAASTDSSSGDQRQRPFVKLSLVLPLGATNNPQAKKQSIPKDRKELIIGFMSSNTYDKTQPLSQIMSSINQFIRTDQSKDTGLLQNMLDPWPDRKDKSKVHTSFVYPILQPLVVDIKADKQDNSSSNSSSNDSLVDNDTDDVEATDSSDKAAADAAKPTARKAKKNANKPQPVAWENNDSTIKVTLYEKNPTGFLAAPLGFSKVLLKDLLPTTSSSSSSSASTTDGYTSAYHGLQPEVYKWFDVTKATHKHDRPEADADTESSRSDSVGETSGNKGMRVLLRLQLELPPTAANSHTAHDFTDLSTTLQEILSERDDKGSSTISNLWNFRDNVKYVQNLMNWILDCIESFKNIFNWTSPKKTMPLYVILVTVCITSAIVPGRYIILAVGLYEFLYKFIPEPEGNSNSIRYANLLHSIPNDDDLESVYHRERQLVKLAQRKQRSQLIRQKKLGLVFPKLWQGRVKMKLSGFIVHNDVSKWEDVYLILQGQRLVWWLNAQELDDNKSCHGQLLLYGHAGITQASPVDIREVGDSHRLISLFGRDAEGLQEKCTILCRDSIVCGQLAAAVEDIIAKKQK